ncbi:MAG: hypothetical protein R2939_16550 [Kofleriaceae bacterium]
MACLRGDVPSWCAISITFALAAACRGGDGGIGAACEDTGDCAPELQCVAARCVERCVRAPDCGDGYACDDDGLCVRGDGQAGDACAREVGCAPGLACLLDAEDLDADGVLAATCAPDGDGAPAGAGCELDSDCRTGTCALGRCVDLCAIDRDCALGTACARIPRVEVAGAPTFRGCLPADGAVTWAIPRPGPAAELQVPVPDTARALQLTMSIDVPGQTVGATRVELPTGEVVYQTPLTEEQYYLNRVRHAPAAPASVLALPGSPDVPLPPGAYRVGVSSFVLVGQAGTATPRVEATIKVGDGVALDLHFHFLDLGEHPCRSAFGGDTLDAEVAGAAPFQGFVQALRTIFGLGGVALRTLTYTDLPGHPDLDAISEAELPALLALGEDRDGVNVFFVRTMTPAGTQALVDGTPGVSVGGAAPLGGVAVAVDTLCYRGWDRLARITAHAIARHLGLFRNREPTGQGDPIVDSDGDPDNLMFYSELGGTSLSLGQRAVLGESPVLR